MSNLALITLHQSVNVQFELHAMLTLESEGIRLAVAALPEMIKRLDLNSSTTSVRQGPFAEEHLGGWFPCDTSRH